MQIKQLINFFFTILMISVFVIGCDNRQQTDDQDQVDTTTIVPAPGVTDTTVVDSAAADTSKMADTTNAKTSAADLKGTWSGTFDSRATTLNITEQNGNEFKGKISINYREQINQEVTGTINPETKKVTMKDMLHSRYAGTYDASLANEGKSLNGTFTMNVDKTKLKFNLSKK